MKFPPIFRHRNDSLREMPKREDSFFKRSIDA